jgi:hypothetical protein
MKIFVLIGILTKTSLISTVTIDRYVNVYESKLDCYEARERILQSPLTKSYTTYRFYCQEEVLIKNTKKKLKRKEPIGGVVSICDEEPKPPVCYL